MERKVQIIKKIKLSTIWDKIIASDKDVDSNKVM